MITRIVLGSVLVLAGAFVTTSCSDSSAASPTAVAMPETSEAAAVVETASTGAVATLSTMYELFYGAEVALEGDMVVIRTDDLPDHQSPYFQSSHPQYVDPPAGMIRNPGEILAQDITLRVPLNPVMASGSDTGLGPIGVAVNGVVIFNQYAAGFQPLDDEILTFDQYNGHPAPPMGAYHYHVEPAWLTRNDDAALVGVLLDGFPVYGPRDSDGSMPQGLDICHGHMGATPEFPEGIYHYHTTSEPPYISGCFRGQPGAASN